MKKGEQAILEAIVRLTETVPHCERHMFIVPANPATRQIFDRKGHETHVDGKVLLVCRKSG
ncbi:hypothetical protein EON82_12465 [bacterium]|nr:MAG: hypothetical protein EON82_12465 [bacterium]